VTDHSVSLIANLITVFSALAIGTRIGYIVAARGTAHHMELMDRHFEHSRQLFENQQKQQRETDLYLRSRDDLKSSYEVLGVWLHQVGQTLDEIYFGAASDNEPMREKAATLVSARPWEVVSPPASAAAAEFYWSPAVLRMIRELQMPYARFISRIRQTLKQATSERTPGPSDSEEVVWRHWQELHSLIAGVKSQAREDILAPGSILDEHA